MTRSSFNKEYLSKSYPDDLLQNVLLKKKIFNSLNVVKLDDGFQQTIKDSNQDIIYKVTSNMIYFKDRKNHILIKIKNN